MTEVEHTTGDRLPRRARVRGGEWVRGAASYFFVSARDEPRIHRVADACALAVASLVIVVSARAESQPSLFVDNVTATVASLPDPVQNLLAATFVVAAIYSAALVLAAMIRRRVAVARDVLFSVAGAVLVAMIVGRIVTGDWPMLGSIGSVLGEEVATFPVVRVAAMNAALLTAAPHLGRPYRRFGYLLIALCAVATLALGRGGGPDVLAAFGVGWAVAAVVHLAFGSPSGSPPTVRVRRALEQLGVYAIELEPLPGRRGGVASHRARAADGRVLLVKVYGRDAISSRWVTRLWRQLWHRGSSLDPTASRRELVEHEALMGLLAARAGVRVPELIAVGMAHPKDAVIALSAAGQELSDRSADDVSDSHLESAWSALIRTHDAGITHGSVSQSSVRIDGDGVLLADWSMSSNDASPESLSEDAAGLLVATALTVGSRRAVDAALAHLGSDGLEQALSYVQPAALDDRLSKAVKTSDLDLDELRVSAATAIGTDPPELIELRRVSIGTAIMFTLVAIALWSLITAITEVGISNLIDFVKQGDLFWLLVALGFGQTPQLAQAIAVQGSMPIRLPFVPLVNEQFAIGFLSLAAPGTAVQVAANTRFLQRQGSSVPVALTAGTLVSVARLVVQLALVLPLVLTDVVDLGVDLDLGPSGFDASVLWVLLGLIAGCGAVVALIPRYRRRMAEWWHIAVEGIGGALRIFRSMRQVAQLFGGNLLSELLLAITLGIVVHAYGGTLGLATLVVIQSGTAVINGFVPIPGGIGVWELLLTGALVAAGVPHADAIAIAISYRLATFYLPPIWGWFSLRWLQRNDYM